MPARLLAAVKSAIGCCLVSILGVVGSLAQSDLQVETRFDREVNLYRWQSTALWNARWDSWQVSVANRFMSDAFIQFDDRLRFRDEDRMRLNADRRFSPKLSGTLRGYVDWFGSSRASSQGILAGVRYEPADEIAIEPLIGFAADRRPGAPLPDGTIVQRSDAGLSGGAAVTVAPLNIAGYLLALDAEGLWEDISPRQGHRIKIRGNAERTFGDARLSSSVRLSSRRRDTYQAASFLNRDQVQFAQSIEATTSDTLDAQLQLLAPVTSGLRILAQANLMANNRRIRTARAPEEAIYFETDFARRAFGGEFGLLYDHGQISAELTAEVDVNAERRELSNRENLPTSEAARKALLLQQADYDEGVLGVQARFRAMIWPRTTLMFTGSSRIVRHDTPTVNLDDRDEVVHNMEMGLQVRASRYLTADVKVFGSYYHAVFLNGERSAENSVQRSLRLRPAVSWRPHPRTRVELASEVRATYTVDDFVLPGRSSQDQSAREMRLETNWEQAVAQDSDFKLTASFADLRLGRLLWDSFSEIPFDTLRTYNLWVRIETGRRLRGELGWRAFVRSDYDRIARIQYARLDASGEPIRDATGAVLQSSINRAAKRWITQMGPAAAVNWSRGATHLRMDAWANMQRVFHILYGTLPESSREHIRKSARQGTRRLIPLVRLGVSWRL